MSKSCIICYKVNDFYCPPPLTTEADAKEDGLGLPAPSSKEQETLRRFFKLLDRYLDEDKPGRRNPDADATSTGFEIGESLGFPLLEEVLNAGVLSCRDCLKVVESFCDLYHKMMSAQLMLNWRLWTLKGIMSSAERVPGRVKDFREIANQLEMGQLGERAMGDVIFDFKKSLVRKCRTKLQNSFPQVLLSREMSEPIQETLTISNIISLSQVNPNPESATPAKKRGRKRKYRSKMIGKSPILQTAPSSQLALAPTGKKNSSEGNVSNVSVRKSGRPRKNLARLEIISANSNHESKVPSWGKAEVAGNSKTAVICDVQDNISNSDLNSPLMVEPYSDFETDPDISPDSKSNKDNNICLQQVKIESEDFSLDVQDEPLLVSASSNLTNNDMNLVSFEEEFEHHTSGKNQESPLTKVHSDLSEYDDDNESEYFPDATDNDDDNPDPGPLPSESEDSESDYYRDEDDVGPTHTSKNGEALQGEDESPETTSQAQSKSSWSSKSLKHKSGRMPKAKALPKSSRRIYQYRCDFHKCPRKYFSREDLDNHRKLHGEFTCHVCNMTHSYAPDLASHELTEHSSTDNETEVPGGKKLTQCPRLNCSFTCRADWKGLFTQHYLLDHMRLDLSKETSCAICGKLFASGTRKYNHSHLRQTQRHHYEIHHNLANLTGDDLVQKCDQADCPAYFLTAVQLRRHKEAVHKIKEDLVCPDCNRRFKRHKTLWEHQASFHLTREALIHPCPFTGCQLRFVTKQVLENHVSFSHSEKKSAIKCKECGKGYKGKAALIAHMRSHDDEEAKRNRPRPPTVKPICEVCGMECKNKGKLAAHQLTHSSPESWTFLCTLCPKKCLNQQRLEVHMRMHTQEKPFVCDLCGLKYAHRHNLKIHMKSSHKGAAWKRDKRGRRPNLDDLSDTAQDQEQN